MFRRHKKIVTERKSKKDRIPVIFLVSMALLGFLAQFQWVGQIVLTIFAVYMFIKHVEARRLFSLALLMLGMVVLAILLGNWLIAQNFAAYSFLAFFYGIILMTLELRRELQLEVKPTTRNR